jgi:SAM-dependent methyltransferase
MFPTTVIGTHDDAELVASRLLRYIEFDEVNGAYLDWQVEQFREFLGQRILEIGVGVGGIVARLGPRELIYGLDIEADVLDYARQRFASRMDCRFDSMDVFQAPANEFACLQTNNFDTVVCINLLEHIENDLGALKRMEQLVRPGGRIALLVPAHRALYGEYDRLDGHFRRYSRGDLRKLVAQTQLQVVKMRYFNSVGAIGWWVQYKFLRRTIHRQGHFRVMNALLPILRRIESRLPPPFGLSLVTVLQRREN